MGGWDTLKARIQEIDKSYMEVLAIRHDRDPATDDLWSPSLEKPHYHIISRPKKNSLKVRTILNALGVVYRPDIDETLWKQHGVENALSFRAMALYLTHDTPEAIKDGKTQYDISEIVSNLSMDEVQKIRGLYVPEKKISRLEAFEQLDKEAYALGYALHGYRDWYAALPLEVRNSSYMRTIRESYDRGIEDNIRKDAFVCRTSVFISGAPNTGKTYAANRALRDMGFSVLGTAGQSTGRYDDLEASTDAIVVDDDTTPHVLTMAEDKKCHAYRRNRNNPAWCGKFFIVTSNKSFDEWLDDCRVYDEEQRDAARSRFFICDIDNRQLLLRSRPDRGDAFNRMAKELYFRDFQDRFNKIMKSYQKTDGVLDLGVLDTAACKQ